MACIRNVGIAVLCPAASHFLDCHEEPIMDALSAAITGRCGKGSLSSDGRIVSPVQMPQG